MNNNHQKELWPILSYNDFKATGYLLHRITQVIGKLKLLTPFEPHWANVALWVTSIGLTTGPIPFKGQAFEIALDFDVHQIIFKTSFGRSAAISLHASSVAEMSDLILTTLKNLGIEVKINLKPQEVAEPILFNEDTLMRPYERLLVNAWWRIILSSYQVMQIFHARFKGITPPVGFMWGTFDLRDVRYSTKEISVENKDFITRNAMDAEQIEIGFWSGNEKYPKPAYFSFTYPKPDNLETQMIKPASAAWYKDLGEFILDYDAVRNAKQPENDLLDFFNSAYEVGAKLAGWNGS